MLKGTAREAAAECFGTFILIAFGVGVVAQNVLSNGANGSYLAINLGWGLAVTLGIYTAAVVSGAHLNPSIVRITWVFPDITSLGSTGRCNDSRSSISWGLIAERLARPAIEPSRDAIQLRLTHLREVGAFRQVLTQQTVGVLVGPALPRTVGVAEVDLDVGGEGERVMGRQFQPAVPGERGHQSTRQRLDATREGLHDGGRIFSAEADEEDVP